MSTEALQCQWIRLERVHASTITNPLAKEERVGAHVGADVENHAAARRAGTEGIVLLAIPRHVPMLRRNGHALAAGQQRLHIAASRQDVVKERLEASAYPAGHDARWHHGYQPLGEGSTTEALPLRSSMVSHDATSKRRLGTPPGILSSTDTL